MSVVHLLYGVIAAGSSGHNVTRLRARLEQDRTRHLVRHVRPGDDEAERHVDVVLTNSEACAAHDRPEKSEAATRIAWSPL